MSEDTDIAGVILAGGRSSRMGQNKALLSLPGRGEKRMLDRMKDVLNQAGLKNIIVAGAVNGSAQDEGVPDEIPFSGPAAAMAGIMKRYCRYKKFLFVPVDMPDLDNNALRPLIQSCKGGYYAGYPLPVMIERSADIPDIQPGYSVKDLIALLGVPALEFDGDSTSASLKNLNTPQDWQDWLAS